MAARSVREMTLVLDGRLGSGLKGATSETAKRLATINTKISGLNKAKVDVGKFRSLKAAVASTEKQFEPTQSEVARLARQIKATSNPSRQLTSQFSKAKSEAGRLKTKLADDRSELERLRRSLKAAGVSTRDLAGDTRKLDTQLENAGREANTLRTRLAKLQGQERRGSGGSSKGGGMLGGVGGLVKGAVGVMAAKMAYDTLKNSYVSVMAAGDAQRRSEARLQQLMGNVPGTTQAAINGVKQYAAQLQNVTTVGDEVSIFGASQLATFQLQGSNIKKLLPALQDLAVGTYGVNVSQEQMQQSANMLGKVFTGQVGALSRAGISLTKAQAAVLKTGTESEKTAMLVEVLGDNYGGLAQKLAETPEGKVARLRNTIGDMKEKISSGLLPVQDKLLSFAVKYMPMVQKITEMVAAAIPSIASGMGGGFSQVYAVIAPLVSFIAGQLIPFVKTLVLDIVKMWQDMWPKIKPALTALTSSIAKLLSSIMPILRLVWSILKPILGFLVGTVLPIVLKVVAAIISVVAGIIGWLTNLKGRWDDIVRIVGIVWQWMQKHKTLVTILNPVVGIVMTLAENWGKVKDTLLTVWEAIKKVWGIFKKFHGKAWDTITTVVGKVTGKAPAKHAKGGIVTRPTLSWIGEQGPEAVVPLRDRARGLSMLDKTAGLLGVGGGGGGITVNANFTINAPGGDPDRIASAMVDAKEDLRRMLRDLLRDEQRTAMA